MSRQLNLYDARFLPQRDWLSAHNLLLGALLSVFVISVGTAFTRWSIASKEEQAKAIMPPRYTGWVPATHASYRLIEEAGLALGRLRPRA